MSEQFYTFGGPYNTLQLAFLANPFLTLWLAGGVALGVAWFEMAKPAFAEKRDT